MLLAKQPNKPVFLSRLTPTRSGSQTGGKVDGIEVEWEMEGLIVCFLSLEIRLVGWGKRTGRRQVERENRQERTI